MKFLKVIGVALLLTLFAVPLSASATITLMSASWNVDGVVTANPEATGSITAVVAPNDSASGFSSYYFDGCASEIVNGVPTFHAYSTDYFARPTMTTIYNTGSTDETIQWKFYDGSAQVHPFFNCNWVGNATPAFSTGVLTLHPNHTTLTLSPTAVVGKVGTPIASVVATVGGYLAPTVAHISPALPSGLVLDPMFGGVSGTPTEASPLTTYTVTIDAAGAQGDTKTFTMEIRAADALSSTGVDLLTSVVLGFLMIAAGTMLWFGKKSS